MIDTARTSFAAAPAVPHAWTSPAMARSTAGDLTIGQILAVLDIAGTIDAARAAGIILQATGGLIAATPQDRLTLVMRRLAWRNGEQLRLTLLGQLVGAAAIAAASRP